MVVVSIYFLEGLSWWIGYLVVVLWWWVEVGLVGLAVSLRLVVVEPLQPMVGW